MLGLQRRLGKIFIKKKTIFIKLENYCKAEKA